MTVYTAVDTPVAPCALCVICLQTISLHAATAGSLYGDGEQAFACNTHLVDRGRWINQWALFDNRQSAAEQLRSMFGESDDYTE